MSMGEETQRLRRIRRDAENGHVAAQTVLAQALLDGAGGPPDPEGALSWWRIAAEAGFAPACNMVGRCLEKGWGVVADPAEAACWYERAVALGDDWARYNLANMLLRGRGVARDRLRAWALFRDAAGNGHAKSMNLVARFLEEGWDRPRDRIAAARWYRRSAEAGDYRGCHNLATLLAEMGRIEEALAWWKRALTDATPDILSAMEAALSQIDTEGSRALLDPVRRRMAQASPPDATAHAPAPNRFRRLAGIAAQ